MEENALRDLALRSSSGDMDALEELIRSFHSNLFGYLHLLGIPARDIEEVAQEVVIQIHRSLRRYRADQPFLPWLRSIARHVTANYWRSHRREQHRMALFQRYLEERVEDREKDARFLDVPKARLEDCLGRLQERHREIVTLRYYQGLDSSRIAERMQLNVAAVRQALSRIREILRACVESSLGLGSG